MAKFGEETLDRWVGRPFDYALFQLERAAKERNKELESFTGYIELCSVLTKLDFDEPVPFSTKEWCYRKMIKLIEWVFIGDCISAPSWLQRTIAHFDKMCQEEHNG